MTNFKYGECPDCGGVLVAGHECPFDPVKFLANAPVAGPLTFAAFKNINLARKARWHAGAQRAWIGPDWGNELAGEAGELCNQIKKIQRFDDCIPQNNFSIVGAMENLQKEIGDVVICAELIAEFYGLSLEECVRYAFNKTSEKNGFPERL